MPLQIVEQGRQRVGVRFQQLHPPFDVAQRQAELGHAVAIRQPVLQVGDVFR